MLPLKSYPLLQNVLITIAWFFEVLKYIERFNLMSSHDEVSAIHIENLMVWNYVPLEQYRSINFIRFFN